MNTWVLLRKLPELIEGAKEDGVRRAAATLQRNYSDSVDASRTDVGGRGHYAPTRDGAPSQE